MKVALIRLCLIVATSMLFVYASTGIAEADTKDRIMRVARSYAGTDYKSVSWNCSDYTRAVMGRATGRWLPDNVRTQRFYGRHPDRLKRGDLIFFAENGGSTPTHVGIYAGKVDGQRMLWHNSIFFDAVVKSEVRWIDGFRPGYTRRIRKRGPTLDPGPTQAPSLRPISNPRPRSRATELRLKAP